MENFIRQVKSVVSIDILILIGIGLILVIVLTFGLMALRKNKARKRLKDMELQYNTLKGVPLAFKLNKAVALSRVNESISEAVDSCKLSFDTVQEKLKDCSVELAEIDDLLYVHKAKKAIIAMESLEDDLQICEQHVNQINETLDHILEQENEQRVHINRLKEKFRAVKKRIDENKASFNQSNEYLELEIADIEKMFSSFEEWMFASEFNKAAVQQQEIGSRITKLEELVDVLPSMYERAKGVLPRAIDEMGFTYAQARNKGVFLEHLEVKRNLEVISDMLKNNLNKLRMGTPEGVHEDLNECEKRIIQLQEQITKEEKAYEEINGNADILFTSVKVVNQDIEYIENMYGKVYERFGFENWSVRLQEIDDKLITLNDMKRQLDKILQEHNIPYTTILISYKELEQSAFSFSNEVNEMKSKLNNACSDEERAKKQLVKLQLIVNEIQVKMRKHRLPSVSQKYQEDLYKAERMIQDIKVILDSSPLDVKELNKELKQAIDYIYTLYNSVNNLVGMAIMVENTIVFGNRYRSSYSEIDSELTRAELCFRNGQYTKALKIGIQCIEKMHPGAYEKLISRKEAALLQQQEA